jgi:hypothetical protein
MEVHAVAKRLKVAADQLRQWQREPAFMSELSRLRADRHRSMSAQIDAGAFEAVNVLRQLLNDKKVPPEARIEAARALLNNAGGYSWPLDADREIEHEGGSVIQLPVGIHSVEVGEVDGPVPVEDRIEVSFERLAHLDNRCIQVLAKRVSVEDLAHALAGSTPALQALFLSNVSRRTREDLKKEMELLAVSGTAIVEPAQSRVIEVALHLAEEGYILFPGERS